MSYFIWYVWWHQSARKIQPKMPHLRENIRGVLLSLVSVYIFALCICVPLGNQFFMSRLSLCDMDDESHTWYYIIWSTAILVILHETYFYWSHRLLHTKFLYNQIHYVHHLARNPSPWSVFLLHPVEAFLQGLFYTMTFLIVPTNWKQLAAFYFVMHLQDMYNHLGYEIYPKGWHKHWLGRWINTAVAHYLHHSGRHGQGNYSFYFLFWDKLMGTEIKLYSKEYERVTES